MPGKLRCSTVDLSNPETLDRVLAALDQLIHSVEVKATLLLRDRYHFRISDRSIPSSPGWYIICSPDGLPIYVGTADNLNSRLNTDNGSRDGFANPQRTSDPERNFIKSFLTAGIFTSLTVLVIPEPSFRDILGLTCELDKLDRGNIEKIINIFRAKLLRLAAASEHDV